MKYVRYKKLVSDEPMEDVIYNHRHGTPFAKIFLEVENRVIDYAAIITREMSKRYLIPVKQKRGDVMTMRGRNGTRTKKSA